MRTAGVGVQALRTGTPDVVEKGANGIGRSARSASRISDLDHSSAHPALADYSLSEICADVPDISLNNAPEAPQRSLARYCLEVKPSKVKTSIRRSFPA
jgi:hypothetical protein